MPVLALMMTDSPLAYIAGGGGYGGHHILWTLLGFLGALHTILDTGELVDGIY